MRPQWNRAGLDQNHLIYKQWPQVKSFAQNLSAIPPANKGTKQSEILKSSDVEAERYGVGFNMTSLQRDLWVIREPAHLTGPRKPGDVVLLTSAVFLPVIEATILQPLKSYHFYFVISN